MSHLRNGVDFVHDMIRFNDLPRNEDGKIHKQHYRDDTKEKAVSYNLNQIVVQNNHESDSNIT